MTAPEKPSLDGLEDKWAAHWDADGTYTVRPVEDARRGVRDRHAAADGERLAARRARVLVHPHRHHRPLPAHARPRGLLPDGVGRQRRADRAAGAELLRRALRPVVALRRRASSRRRSRASRRSRSAGRTSSSCATGSWSRTSRSSRSSGARSACRSTGRLTYTTIGERARRASQRAFLRMLARGEAYQSEAPTLWDVDFRMAVVAGGARGPRAAGRVPRGALRRHRRRRRHRHRDHPPRADPRVRRAGGAPRRRALLSRASAHEVTTPLFGVRVPVLAHPLADPEKGSGIAMICTFGDTTDVVWWRELQLPTRTVDRPRRSPAARAARLGRARRPRPTARYARARGQDRQAGAGAHRRAARRARRAGRRAEADHAPGEVLRAGRPSARDRDVAPVVHPQRRSRPRAARGVPRARARAARGIPRTCAAATRAGSRASTRDWLISRQRYFGVPFPLWYPLDADGEVDYDHPIVPDEAAPADRPHRATSPAGYTEDQRGKAGRVRRPTPT